MTIDELRMLTTGDRVRLTSGAIGYVQWFGFFNGRRWVRSARKRADGVWLWLPDGTDGYVSHLLIECYMPPELLTRKEALSLKYETEEGE